MKCQRPVVAAAAPRQDRRTLAHEPTIPEPRISKPTGNKVKPTSPFHQAVLQEASRYQTGGTAVGPVSSFPTASSEPAGERERLQEELRTAEATIPSLEAAAADSGIKRMYDDMEGAGCTASRLTQTGKMYSVGWIARWRRFSSGTSLLKRKANARLGVLYNKVESFKKAKAQMDRTMQNQGKRVEVLQKLLNDPTTADHHKLLLVGERMENFKFEDETTDKIK